MDKDYKYGFMLGDELLHAWLTPGGVYQLTPPEARIQDIGNPSTWEWFSTSPTLFVHMYLKREHFKGAIPSHPIPTYGNADPVVIITYRDGDTLHKEYHKAIMPRLLPEGVVVDRATLGKEATRRNVFTYRCPPTVLGTMYASAMGNRDGGTYFMTECGEPQVFGYLCHISKEDCLLLCLDKGEVGEALVHGYIPSAKGVGLID